MSESHNTALPELRDFKMSLVMRVSLLVLVSIGAVSLWLVFQDDATRGWYNYLIGSVMFLSFGLFGLFFILINHLVISKWCISVKRLYEAMALTLPVAAILFLFVYMGVEHIYEWSHPEAIAADPVLAEKTGFLNAGFFGLRMIIYFAIWIFATGMMVSRSLKQDLTGDVNISFWSRRASAILMVLFALSACLAGFDYLMSLEPHWFSTIYGVYFFACFFQFGLVGLYLITAYLYKTGRLEGFVNKTHFHDIGKFIFAFSVFWAYIAFSQFMLYWYGDLPEETFWYKIRMNEGWEWIGLLVLAIRWGLPFLVLLPFGNKMNFKVAIPVCFALLFGNWLDLYWNAMPATRLMHHAAETVGAVAHHGAWFSIQEVLVGVGFIALFFLVFGSVLERLRIVAVGDPRLPDSVHHHG